MRITPEYAKKSREEAFLKYQQEQNKLVLQMILMSYYKLRSNLSEKGLRKILEIDSRRENDEVFNKEFSKIIFKATEYAWEEVLGQLIIKISDAYALKTGEDLSVESPEDDPKLDFFV